MPPYKRQHYVPQSYLRAWSENGAQIWSYNFYTADALLVPVKTAAQDTYFNDAFLRDNGVMRFDLPPHYIEATFRRIEDQFLLSRRVAEGIAAGTHEPTDQERRLMALCVAVQLTRTARFRDLLSARAAQPRTGRPTDFIGWLPVPLQQAVTLLPQVTERHLSLFQHLLIWDSDLVPTIAGELVTYLWVVARNGGKFPFYASDAPVSGVRHPAGALPVRPPLARPEDARVGDDLVKRLFVGEGVEDGCEVVFPLSPRLALLMFHPVDFREGLTAQTKALSLDQNALKLRNGVIAAGARRHVYASTREFTIAQAVRPYSYGTGDPGLDWR